MSRIFYTRKRILVVAVSSTLLFLPIIANYHLYGFSKKYSPIEIQAQYKLDYAPKNSIDHIKHLFYLIGMKKSLSNRNPRRDADEYYKKNSDSLFMVIFTGRYEIPGGKVESVMDEKGLQYFKQREVYLTSDKWLLDRKLFDFHDEARKYSVEFNNRMADLVTEHSVKTEAHIAPR